MKSGANGQTFTEARAILRICAPLAAAYLAEIAMGITDMVIVGRVGSVELAGVGLASNVLFEILLVCVGIVSIVAVLAAEARGAGSIAGVRRAVRHGFLVALALGIPGAIIGWNLAPVLALTGQDPAVVAFADDYLEAAAWFIIPYLLFVVLRSFLAAVGRAGAVMVVTVAAVGVNAVTTYGLVFGALGMPALGVAGAGWATTITVALMLVALAMHTLASRHLRPFAIHTGALRPDAAFVGEIFRLGLPAAGISLLESGMFVAAAIFMGVLGASWLAANQIMFNVISVGFVIALAVGEASGVRIAHGVGAGTRRAVHAAAVTGIVMGAAVMVTSAGALWLYPERIVSVFLDVGDPANAEVVAYAVILAGIAAVFQLFDGLQAVAARGLRGLKDTLVPMWIASFGYWVLGLLGGWALCFPLGYGAVGLWWGLAIGLITTGGALVWRLLRRTRASGRCGR